MSIISKVRDRLSQKKNEDGNTLIDVVISMAIFLALGAAYVFATQALYDAQRVGLTGAKDSMSIGGISSSFKGDANRAAATRIDEMVTTIDMRLKSGECVRWTIKPETQSNGANGELRRYTKSGSAITASDLGYLMKDDLIGGGFSLDGSNAGIQFSFGGGAQDFTQSSQLKIASGSKGVCW